MDKKVDILHPLATVHWEECRTLPRLNFPRCVSLGGKIYITEARVGASSFLYVTSEDLTSWTEHTTLPTSYSAFIAYQSKLVLVGGDENSTGKFTNKLWTSVDGMKWEPSLPPMPTARKSPSAVNTASPELLVIAGGEDSGYKYSDVVEVLVEGQWMTVQPLPMPRELYDCTLHNGKLYFSTKESMYQCDLQSLVVSCTKSGVNKSINVDHLWNEILIEHTYPMGLASFGQQLITSFTSGFFFELRTHWCKLMAYSPRTHSWVYVGDIPYYSTLSFFSYHAGDLTALARQNNYASCIFRASLTVSSYDPDSSFNMSSLSRLEDAGFMIVTSLADKFTQLIEITGIIMTLDDRKESRKIERLEKAINRWKVGGGRYPLTWKSLLDDVLQAMDLKELSQQIKDYLSGTKQPRQHITDSECVSAASTNAEIATVLDQPPPTIALLSFIKWRDEHGQKQTFRLVNQVSVKWHDFGLYLGLSLNQLDAWEIQEQADASKCWNRVMNHWLASGGTHDYPATWDGLYSLLDDLVLSNVAKDLKTAVVGYSSSSRSSS